MVVSVKSRVFKKLFTAYYFKMNKMSNEFHVSLPKRIEQPPAWNI